MSFEFKKKLPIPREIKEMYPMSEALTAHKQKMDQKIIDVITGASDKFLVIIGPCSADSEDSVCEYIGRLARLQEKVADRLILVPRISRIRKKNRIFCKASSLSVNFI